MPSFSNALCTLYCGCLSAAGDCERVPLRKKEWPPPPDDLKLRPLLIDGGELPPWGGRPPASPAVELRGPPYTCFQKLPLWGPSSVE